MAQQLNVKEILEGKAAYSPVLLRIPQTSMLDPDPQELLKASEKTAEDILVRKGMKREWLTSADEAAVEEVFMEHVEHDPKANTHTQQLKPIAVLKLEALLNEHDWQVVRHADQIRSLVTNKLLLLSDHKDPRIQLKAIELLGKLADVGMFVDKQEITYKHQSSDELQKRLQDKLGVLIQGEVTERGIEPPEEHPNA